MSSLAATLFVSLSFLLLLHFVDVSRAQTCDTAQNAPNNFNPACSSTAPYCVAGGCIVCDPYALDNYLCDCPAGKGCNRDFYTLGSQPGTCVTMPKYGSSCASDSDCKTVYTQNQGYNVQLLCVTHVCRYCNPATLYNDTVCQQGHSQYPQTRNCIPPGIWGVPLGPDTSTNLATATTATTTAATTTSAASATLAQGGTTTGASLMLIPSIILLTCVIVIAHALL